jgi:hypothetical protein
MLQNFWHYNRGPLQLQFILIRYVTLIFKRQHEGETAFV